MAAAAASGNMATDEMVTEAMAQFYRYHMMIDHWTTHINEPKNKEVADLLKHVLTPDNINKTYTFSVSPQQIVTFSPLDLATTINDLELSSYLIISLNADILFPENKPLTTLVERFFMVNEENKRKIVSVIAKGIVVAAVLNKLRPAAIHDIIDFIIAEFNEAGGEGEEPSLEDISHLHMLLASAMPNVIPKITRDDKWSRVRHLISAFNRADPRARGGARRTRRHRSRKHRSRRNKH